MPKNKYGNEKVALKGMSFASKAEAALYQELHFRVLGGELRDLQCQDHVYLTDARILYVADFKAFNLKTKQDEWFEQKGYETDVWRIKRRLWMYYGPGVLHVYKGLYLKESIRSKA